MINVTSETNNVSNVSVPACSSREVQEQRSTGPPASPQEHIPMAHSSP